MPIGSWLIARCLTALKPAVLVSTLRSIENGSARTAWSATTSRVTSPCRKLSVNVASALRRTATSSEPRVIWPGSAAASRCGI